MKPLPWSHSALECFGSCPEQYRHKYVLKDLPPEQKTAQQDWGTYVHKQFEYFLTRRGVGFELPHDLKIHEPYLQKLYDDGEAANCFLVAEQKVALSTDFKPCEYFDKKVQVWWRGVIDVQAINRAEGRARIADFKTGKKKDDWVQLAENAVWMFMNYPWLQLINAQYYWTSDQTSSKKVWGRGELDSLIAMFAPTLSDYVQAFKTDTWTKKQSGLCKGWCPVTTCEFWEDKRKKY